MRGKKPGRVVLVDLRDTTKRMRDKGGKACGADARRSEIVLHTRPVGPVDFTPRDLVYHIACEASIMGTIPQAILRPQAPTHQSKIRARSSPSCVLAQ